MITPSDITSLRNALAEVLANMPYRRKEKADKLMATIIYQFRKLQSENDRLRSDQGSITADQGLMCMKILMLLGFSPPAIEKLLDDPDFIGFMTDNMGLLKEQLTPAWLMKSLNLYHAYKFEFDREPKDLRALGEYAAELEGRKPVEFDAEYYEKLDEKISELKN